MIENDYSISVRYYPTLCKAPAVQRIMEEALESQIRSDPHVSLLPLGSTSELGSYKGFGLAFFPELLATFLSGMSSIMILMNLKRTLRHSQVEKQRHANYLRIVLRWWPLALCELLDCLFDEIQVPQAVYNQVIVTGKPAVQTLKSYLQGKLFLYH